MYLLLSLLLSVFTAQASFSAEYTKPAAVLEKNDVGLQEDQDISIDAADDDEDISALDDDFDESLDSSTEQDDSLNNQEDDENLLEETAEPEEPNNSSDAEDTLAPDTTDEVENEQDLLSEDDILDEPTVSTDTSDNKPEAATDLSTKLIDESNETPTTIDPTLDDDEDILDDDQDLLEDDEDDITDEELGDDVELVEGADPDDLAAEEELFADDEEFDEYDGYTVNLEEEGVLPEDDEEDTGLTASDAIEDDDNFFFDEDDEGEEEQGTFDPKTGAKITHALFGELIFAPSKQAQENSSAKPLGKATTRTLELSKQMQAGQQASGISAVITKPNLSVTEKGNLSFTGILNANNKKGKLKLVSFQNGEMTFTVEFPRTFDIQITPDRVVKVKNFKLIISDSGEVEFLTKKFVFTSRPENYDPEDEEEDTTIKFGITSQDTTSEATAEELPLYKVMPSAKGKRDLEKIMLEELVFNIANPFSSKPAPSEITIECTAKLDHIKIFGSAHLSNSTCEISLDRDSAELISEGDSPIIFDDAMTLEKPLIEITATKGEKPEFTLGGVMACNFPVIGKMRLPIQGEKREDGITLKGKIEKKIGFGPIKFGDPELLIMTSDGSSQDESADASGDAGASSDASTDKKKPKRQKKIEISGTAKFFGLGIKPIMRLVKPADGGKRKISFSAKFDAPNLNPIAKIPGLKSIPGLSSFKIPQAFLGMNSAKKFFIGGTTKLFGIAGKVKVIPKNKIVDIASSKPWRLSDTIPSAKGTIFDSVIMNNIRFAAAAKEGYDDATDTRIRKGLNAFGTLDTSQGMFANLRKMMGGALPTSVTAAIIINPNPRQCKYVVMLPFDVKLSSKAILHSLSFEISGEPSVALMVTLKFMPTKSDPPLLFTARIEFELIGCALSATMAGFWHHPFGIKGVHVGDLAVEAKLPYAIPPIPIAFGLAGTIQVGEFLLKVAVKLGADDIILLAEVTKLPIFFWLDLIKMVGMDLGPLDFLKAIDIYLENVKFKFAPTGGQIGTLMFEQGISGQGKLRLKVPHIIDLVGEAGFNLNIPNGFKLYAYVPAFSIGPLKVTGKGPDQKYGTEDDGAILRIVLGLLEQRAFLSAQAECLGSKGLAEVDFRISSVKFKMILNFLNILESKIIGESYRKGLRLGFRVMSLFKIGRSKMKMVGDMSTYGFMLGSRTDSLTIRDLGTIMKIPESVLPDIGFKDVESYIRFMPGQMIDDAVRPSLERARRSIASEVDELRGNIKETKEDLKAAAQKANEELQKAHAQAQAAQAAQQQQLAQNLSQPAAAAA